VSHAATLARLEQQSIKTRFDRDGYIAFNNITTHEELTRIPARLDSALRYLRQVALRVTSEMHCGTREENTRSAFSLNPAAG
jgi:hypothetical protein